MNDISNLREIQIKYIGDKEYTKYLLLEKDVDNMVEALIKLHIEPGINPHNGCKCGEIVEILISLPAISSYWWTSSDLSGKGLSKKAKIIEFYTGEPLYLSKEKVIEQCEDCARDNAGESYAATLEENPEALEKELKEIRENSTTYIHPKYAHLITIKNNNQDDNEVSQDDNIFG